MINLKRPVGRLLLEGCLIIKIRVQGLVQLPGQIVNSPKKVKLVFSSDLEIPKKKHKDQVFLPLSDKKMIPSLPRIKMKLKLNPNQLSSHRQVLIHKQGLCFPVLGIKINKIKTRQCHQHLT